MSPYNQRHGFTLIELSIVLVIIGLIVGGVLMGNDLIAAAKVRSQLSQLEKYKAATNAFRTKYNGLPGDLRAADAASFGMITRSGVQGSGDGNGRLASCDGGGGMPSPSDAFLGCETALFWTDLSFAQMIPGSFSTATDTIITADTSQLSLYLPPAIIGANFIGPNYIVAYTGNGTPIGNFGGFSMAPNLPQCFQRLCFAIVPLLATNNVVGFMPDDAAANPGDISGVTPSQAFSMDTKLDDGKPLTGSVMGGAIDMGNLNIIDATDATYLGWGTADPNPCLAMLNAGATVNDYSYKLSSSTAACSMNFIAQ